MSEIPEEYIINVINALAVQNNLKECHHSRLKFKNLAQNYFGVLIPLVLNAKKEAANIQIDIVLKLAPTDERFRVSGALTHFFLREIFVYSVILEKYRILQSNFPQSLQFLMPLCYYVNKTYCNEAIVLENMCTSGYKPYTNRMFLDFDHINVSLKSLAKLHALSFIMKEQDRKLYEECLTVCLPLTAENNKRFMDILKDRLDKALGKLEKTKYVPMLEYLKQNLLNIVESSYSKVQRTCICHGDIWKENILFKYEDEKPVSACIIDYQTARTMSPAFDVLYLITTSTTSELRLQHYTELLATYYDMFASVLSEAGLVPETVYSREMFDSDLNVVGPSCFVIANTALWLSNGLQKEGHVRSRNPWNTEEEEVEAVNRYKSVIVGIIDDYVGYGYLIM